MTVIIKYNGYDDNMHHDNCIPSYNWRVLPIINVMVNQHSLYTTYHEITASPWMLILVALKIILNAVK